MGQYIQINPADNVAVALQPIAAGTVLDVAGSQVKVMQDIPAGHKVTLCPLNAGDNVIKYGFPIGHVTKSVEAGVSIDHNCIKTNLEGLSDYTYEPSLAELERPAVRRTFRGFRRQSGEVGIRNQI